MEKETNARLTIIVLVATLVVLLALILSLTLNLSLVENLVMSWIFTTLYSLFAFYMVGDKIETFTIKPVYIEREVFMPAEIVEKQVIQNVPVQIPVESKTIEVVDRPIYIDRPVIQRVFVKRRKLNIPKYKYLASSQTKRFHKTSCRLSKLIKERIRFILIAKPHLKESTSKRVKFVYENTNLIPLH